MGLSTYTGPLRASLGPRETTVTHGGPLQAALLLRDRGAPPTLRGQG